MLVNVKFRNRVLARRDSPAICSHWLSNILARVMRPKLDFYWPHFVFWIVPFCYSYSADELHSAFRNGCHLSREDSYLKYLTTICAECISFSQLTCMWVYYVHSGACNMMHQNSRCNHGEQCACRKAAFCLANWHCIFNTTDFSWAIASIAVRRLVIPTRNAYDNATQTE